MGYSLLRFGLQFSSSIRARRSWNWPSAWSLRWYILRPRNQYNEPGPAQSAKRLSRRPLGGITAVKGGT
jgi:hypothetical protein